MLEESLSEERGPSAQLGSVMLAGMGCGEQPLPLRWLPGLCCGGECPRVAGRPSPAVPPPAAVGAISAHAGPDGLIIDVVVEGVTPEDKAMALALDAVEAAVEGGWEEATVMPASPLSDLGSVTHDDWAKQPDDWAEEPVSLGALAKTLQQATPALRQAPAMARPVTSLQQPTLRSLKEPALAWQLLERSLDKANAVGEAPLAGVQIWEEESGSFADLDIQDTAQSGSCGFTAVLKRPPPGIPGSTRWGSRGGALGLAPPCPSEGVNTVVPLGMCHHFTWDGKHCANAGLPSEHANRCVGYLYAVGFAANSQLCRGVGMQGYCGKDLAVDLIEVACGPPPANSASQLLGGCCRRTCPFLAEGGTCPYVPHRPRRPDEPKGKPMLFHL